MDATNPVTINGQTYPVWQISLAISQNLTPAGKQPISFALRCVPARLTGDELSPINTLDSAAMTLVRGSEADISDPDERAAFEAIRLAIITYLVAKGL